MQEVERKLTTILATDVVAFSDMMGRDEIGTMRILKACHGVIEDCIRQHKGRVFGAAGDSLIAEFASPLLAVLCATEFQRRIAARNQGCPEGERMWFRVGINLGDVIIDGDNLFGDGVNIAARLEQEGEPGGVCVSHKVYEEVRRNAGISFSDGGQRVLKNIDRPVGVYHARPESGNEDRPQAPDTDAAGPLPLKRPVRSGDRDHSLVVRTFKVAGDEDVAFFADGLRDGLLNSLSRHATIDVVHESPDTPAWAAFALESSIRGRDGHMRLTFSLIDTKTNRQLWSERYDRSDGDTFELEDEISRAVAAVVRIKLKEVEFAQLRGASDEDLSVADLLNKAATLFVGGPGNNDLIENSLRLAIAREPDNSMAVAMLAACLLRRFEYSPLALPLDLEKEIVDLAGRAVALNAESYYAHLVAGIVAQDISGGFERALRHAQAALDLNPNLLAAHGLVGIVECHRGDFQAGIGTLRQTLDANREDPHRFRHQRELAIAYFIAGEIETATDLIGRLVESEPNMDRNRLVHAALLSLGDDAEEADAAWRHLRHAYPSLSLSTKRATWIGRADAAARFEEALAAGLEG